MNNKQKPRSSRCSEPLCLSYHSRQVIDSSVWQQRRACDPPGGPKTCCTSAGFRHFTDDRATRAKTQNSRTRSPQEASELHGILKVRDLFTSMGARNPMS